MTGLTRDEVICTWPSCGHSARGQCNSHLLIGLCTGNHTLDILAAENAALRERLEAAEAERDYYQALYETGLHLLTQEQAENATGKSGGSYATRSDGHGGTARLDAARYEGWNAAYLAGFNASGEGWNGEYPFSDKSKSPEDDPDWIATRDRIRALSRNYENSTSSS